MFVTYYLTLVTNSIVSVSCTCIWLILFMNVALQFFVASETAYFSNGNKLLHRVVTIGLLPTILIFWTFIMWFILSRCGLFYRDSWK